MFFQLPKHQYNPLANFYNLSLHHLGKDEREGTAQVQSFSQENNFSI
jgi:hypothetical protein